MKDRRKRSSGDVVSWSRFFWCTLFVVFTCVLFTGFTFSSFRFLFGETLQPVLVLPWRAPQMEAISGDSPVKKPYISIREIVLLPDQALVFLNCPPPARLFTKDDLHCVYFPANDSSSSQRRLKKLPREVDGDDPENQIVRCPLQPRGFTVAVALKPKGELPSGPSHRWNSLAYEALIDRDNTTIIFVKGLNLKPERVSNASRFECVYGWDFRKPKFLLRTDVVSIAQEIVRCKTPLSVLNAPQRANSSVKVSVRIKGKGILPTIARPISRTEPNPQTRKSHEMCVCTMVRNQGRFVREWVKYHAEMGVDRWFIYDNNSDDDIDFVIESLVSANYNVTRHVWPWIKTQEAGFAHCALRARDSCNWVGFIDVDEFFHLPSGLFLHDVLHNQSKYANIAELRVSCYSFGPSGLKHVPPQGVTVGYTCRLAAPERHKSIVKPEALNSSLINVVHHFHLRDGFRYVNMDKGEIVINHYKYQVWEVFKEKFYRRVATYVADWQDEQNVGSKDRAPGLGTRAVEPPDWSSRFCEVTDTGLRDRVLTNLVDPQTHLLPWQEVEKHKKSKMVSENPKRTPSDSKNPQKDSDPTGGGGQTQNDGIFISPRFKSVAAMAGWDEEALLTASLVVDDTPDRESKQKKRSDLLFKTPPSNSRRKRRAQRRSPILNPVAVLDLDDEEITKCDTEKDRTESTNVSNEEKKTGEDKLTEESSGVSCSSMTVPCMDKLKEELSCAICLEICYEPSTTSCGHSFCRKCLRSAADKCGKRCPKCRQLISNGRSCTVNTVLWNTIQLLFPEEVEARKDAGALNSREAERQRPEKEFFNSYSNRRTQVTMPSSRDVTAMRRRAIPSADMDGELYARRRSLVRPSRSSSRRGTVDQDEDAALALRLQREEFMEAFDGQSSTRRSLSMARANLRAMASRAVNLRVRGQHV
nr:glycosyltransferase family 92 protein RCOM_0530710 [Ziziphus jujuba var. spinosa]